MKNNSLTKNKVTHFLEQQKNLSLMEKFSSISFPEDNGTKSIPDLSVAPVLTKDISSIDDSW